MFKGICKPLLLLGAALPWLGIVGFCSNDDPSGWTTAQWTAWRDQQIQRILAPTFENGGEKILDREEVYNRAAEAYKILDPQLKSSEFLADPDRCKALGNFVKFVTAQHWMAMKDDNGIPTNALGMDVSDKDYWSYASPMLAPPDLLKGHMFLTCMSQQGTYNYAADLIAQQNQELPEDQKWIVYLFRGQFVRSVDRTTYGRLLVVVPNVKLPGGRLWDRWISFAVATPDMLNAPPSMSVSVIATVRDPKTPGISHAYFADYLRERDAASGELQYHSTYFRKPNPSLNCYNCHKSAVLPIRPKEVYEFDDSGDMVAATDKSNPTQDQLDKLISSYGKTLMGHIDSDAYGPSLGPVRDRSDEFIRETTKDHPIDLSSYPAIKSAMNCGSCHAQIGKLNFLLGVQSDADVKTFEPKRGLVQSFIEQGIMPPNNSLTPDERHALWECVTKEYFDSETMKGDFVEWLKGG